MKKQRGRDRIFRSLSWRFLKENRTRMVITIIGVILSAAMLTGVMTIIVSIYSALVEDVKNTSGDWHFYIQGEQHSLWKKLEENPDVDQVVRLGISGYTEMTDSVQEKLYGNDAAPFPYLPVLAAPDIFFQEMPMELRSGRLPENESEIMISEMLYGIAGTYHIGDTISVKLGIRRFEDGSTLWQNIAYMEDQESFEIVDEKEYTITGIYSVWNYDMAYSMLGYSTQGEEYRYEIDYVRMKQPGMATPLLSELLNNNDYTGGINYTLLAYEGVAGNMAIRRVLQGLGVILILIVMGGSVLLIYNAFSISVGERTRQIGLLSSIGATPRQIRRMIHFEGVLVYLIGMPVGTLCGIGGIGLTLQLTGDALGDLFTGGTKVTLQVEPMCILTAALVTGITIWLSAFLPAFRAARISAMEAIRQNRDIMEMPGNRLTGKRTERKRYCMGFPGLMTDRTFRRAKSRYRITVLSLTVSIVLFFAASVLTSYLTQSLSVRMSFVGNVNLCYGMFTNTPNHWNEYTAFYPKLAENENTKASSWMLEREYNPEYMDVKSSVNGTEVPTMLVVLDDENFLRLAQTAGYTEKEADAGLVLAYTEKGSIDENGHLEKGEVIREQVPFTVLLESGGKTGRITVDGISNEEIPGISNQYGYLYVLCSETGSRAVYGGAEAFFDGSMEVPKNSETASFSMNFSVKKVTETLELFRKEMTEAGLDTYGLYDLDDGNRIWSQIMAVRVFSYGFLTLVFLIAMANVFYTISTNLTLRRREFAMLKSVGLGDRQFHTMLFLECCRYTTRSMLSSILPSAVIILTIHRVVGIGFDVPFTVPAKPMLLCLLALCFLTGISTYYAVQKTKKDTITDMLREN